MKKLYLSFLLLFAVMLCGNISFAQIAGAEIFLPGHFLEIGINKWGAFGSVNTPPAAYHPYPAGSPLGETYDFGHDGWTVGAPVPYYGDYTLPGTPYEGWGIQVGSAAGLNWMLTENLPAYFGGGITGPGSLGGANTTYVNAGGKLIGNWAGTTAGGQLKINMATEVDTNASWVTITTKFYNTGATALNNIYYFRGLDPDNDEVYSFSFATTNVITYQNDADHRVGVSSAGTSYTGAYLQLCTKDCRAKSFIEPSWPVDDYVTDMSTLWLGTSGTTSSYTVGTTNVGDYGEGVVWNIGTIAAGDSNFVSYSYTFKNTAIAIDSALPEPTLVLNGILEPPTSPPPAVNSYTLNACGLAVVPADILFATTGDWTWGTWTWAPATGLATTTGVTNTINISAIPPSITYTITGTDSRTCASRLMYITITSCNSAVVNSPCVGDPLIFNAPGDSTGATYIWYGPAPSTTIVGTTQSFTITPSTMADGGTYHVVKTIGGIHDTALVVAVINPVPVISGSHNVCVGSSITLTSTVAGGTWSVSNAAIATITTTGVVTGVSPGVVTITDLLSTGCFGTYTVTVNPVAPITGTTSLCVGATTSLNDVIPGGTWFSVNPGVATITGLGLVTGNSGGTSTISYTTPAGCVSVIVVTVNPALPITGTTAICAGGTSTLANAIPGGTWLSGTPSVATVGLMTGVVNGVSMGTSIITYTTPAGCISMTTVNIVVLSAITGTELVCQGSSVTLFDGAGGGVWSSGSPGIATIGPSSGVVSGISGGTSNITYTGGGGCYTTAVVTVVPSTPIFGILSMCQGFTTTLGNATTGGAWSSLSTGVATVNGVTGVVTGITAGTATIRYIMPAGCVVSTVVTVNPQPAKPIPSTDVYCQFSVASPVSATPATGLLWYGPGFTGAMTIPPTPGTSIAGTVTYYVTETNSFGCVSDSAIDIITITAQPAPPVTTDSIYCQFAATVPLNYQIDTVPGSKVAWYTAATGGVVLAGAPLPSSAVVTYPSGTTWYVSQTVNGCTSNLAPVKVSIIYQPSFTITASNTWVCDHDSLTFTYHGSTALIEGTYVWSLPPGATCIGGTTVTDPTIIVRFDSVGGQHVLTLSVGELNNLCVTTDTISVRVVPPPTTHCYMKPDVCLGDTVSLSLTDRSNDANVFSWFIDGTPLTSSAIINIVAANSNSGGPFSISWNDSGNHVITVTCTTNEGCRSDPEYDSVHVHPLPDPVFTIAPKATGSLCLEDSILFIARHQDANCSYLWEPEHCFNNNNKPEIWGKVEQGRTDITLTITDPFGCKSSYDMQLSPDACCTVLFPTAFTPNGDGLNDKYRPIFNGFHNFHQFRVVNRWGQTVFESANSNPEWDGSFNGVPQDMGVYYYYIKFDCGGNVIEQKGDCTLVR